MANDFYNHGGWPATGAAGASSPARSELDSITAGFDKLPTLTGNANRAVVVNAGGTGLTVTAGTLALAGNLTLTGAFNLTLVVGATVTLTLPTISDTLVGRTTTDTLTNKTLTTPIIAAILTNGGASTLTLPTTTDTLVGRATTDTLTNKTLTSPIIATILTNAGAATLTLPTATDTLVGRLSTDTLTNKTFNLANNTLTGTTAQFNTALSDSDFVTGASFAAKGNLLVGTGVSTFAALAVGADGTIPAADSNQSSGLKYVNVAGESFHGTIRNHPDNDSVNSKIRADLSVATMNDGHVYTPGQGLIFDKTVTGTIGGMQAAAVNSTWNKLYYARKRSDGSEGLWGLRAKNFLNDTSFTTASDAVRNLRILTSTPTDRLAQGVTFATAGFLEFVDVYLIRSGAVGGNVWFELWDDSAGNPGTLRATSDKYDASRMATSEQIVRFPFRSPFSVSTSTQYHVVMQGDYSRSDTIFIGWRGVAAGGYTGGSAKQFNGSTWSAATGVGDFNFKAYIRQNDTALALPAGYDQYVQIGWFYIGSGGNINKFYAEDRVVETLGASWKIGTIASGALTLLDLATIIPPQPCKVSITSSHNQATLGTRAMVGKLTATDLATDLDWSDAFVRAQEDGINSTFAPINGPYPILLEYQAMYGRSNLDTIHFWSSAFTW